jgi:hypothetical protein
MCSVQLLIERFNHGSSSRRSPRLRPLLLAGARLRAHRAAEENMQAVALLGALGFEHVKVVFEEPPKT